MEARAKSLCAIGEPLGDLVRFTGMEEDGKAGKFAGGSCRCGDGDGDDPSFVGVTGFEPIRPPPPSCPGRTRGLAPSAPSDTDKLATWSTTFSIPDITPVSRIAGQLEDSLGPVP